MTFFDGLNFKTYSESISKLITLDSRIDVGLVLINFFPGPTALLERAKVLFGANFLGPTFIPCPTSIPESKVN